MSILLQNRMGSRFWSGAPAPKRQRPSASAQVEQDVVLTSPDVTFVVFEVPGVIFDVSRSSDVSNDHIHLGGSDGRHGFQIHTFGGYTQVLRDAGIQRHYQR